MSASNFTDERFEHATRRSQALHGHKYVLPVAVWVHERQITVVKAPDVVRGLHGRTTPNRALEALVRLSNIGAMNELPHPGQPHPRVFEKIESPYWDFAAQYIATATSDAV